MAVFRIEKTRDYTVMSNYHLRDIQTEQCALSRPQSISGINITTM